MQTTFSMNFEAGSQFRNLEKARAKISALPDLSAKTRTPLTFFVRSVSKAYHIILIPLFHDASRPATFDGGIGCHGSIPVLCCIHR